MKKLLKLAAVGLVGVSAIALSAGNAAADYTLNILHINDYHSRIEPINAFDSTCGAEDDAAGKCFGGIARVKTKIDERRNALIKNGQNVLLLHAGDQFQGSLFYSTYKGDAAVQFMNQMGFDAMAIGNHEFDDGPEVLAKFIGKANFPVISGNTLARASIPFKGGITQYVIKEISGQKVGIVSVLTTDTNEISSPGGSVVIIDEVSYLKTAVAKLTGMGVNKIILLSHVGLNRDKEIAAAVDGIDVIVGGHSHSLLSNVKKGAVDTYPVRVKNPAGKQVPIVQAYAYSKYLGELRVTFDDNGNVLRAGGEPHLLDASVTPDAAFVAEVAKLGGPIEELKAKKVSSSTSAIEGSREVCRAQECAMGNLVADAMLDRVKSQGVRFAIQNGGGLRASVDAGEVTMGDVLTVLPFQNTLSTFSVKGADVIAALENGVSRLADGAGRFAQVSGLKYTFDKDAEAGKRVSGVMVADGDGFVPIDPAATYLAATNDYVRKGGDGFAMFKNASDAYDFGPNLELVVADYLSKNDPYTPYTDGRITTAKAIEKAAAVVEVKTEVAAAPAFSVPPTTLGAGILSMTGPKIDLPVMEPKPDHVIVAGDNYWNLAKKFYGDSQMWTKLDSANPSYRIKGLQIGAPLVVPK